MARQGRKTEGEAISYIYQYTLRNAVWLLCVM